MHCRRCGTSLSPDATFCATCGHLAPRQNSQSEDAEQIQTFKNSTPPSYHHLFQSPSDYGSPTLRPETSHPSPSMIPPLRLPRRVTPAFLVGLLSGILILVLLAGSLLFFKQRALLSFGSPPSPQQTPPNTLPTPTATAPIVPSTPAPAAQPATVVYQADWSAGFDGWTGSQDWHVQKSMLISDGTNNPDADAGPTILAPYHLTTSSNFAIELRAQLVQANAGFDPLLFHGSLTPQGWQGYKLTMCGCNELRITSDTFSEILGHAPFAPGTSWHTYRLEVRGSIMAVMVDGTLLFTTQDSRYLSGDQIGIKSSTPIIVSNFTITTF